MGGIPSQWERFLTRFGYIPTQVDKVAYGVIFATDDGGNFDYIAAQKSVSFLPTWLNSQRIRIPLQTYAVFQHADHISNIGARCSWNQGLPDSGYKAADSPWFERYGEEFNGRTGTRGLEIWIPMVR